MRIVHVVPNFELGGIQKGGCVLARAMAARGHEAHVFGFEGGPRFLQSPQPNLAHHAVEKDDVRGMAEQIIGLSADVVHIHWHAYWPEMIELLWRAPRRPLIVSTPVFGRVPLDVGLLEQTRTCLVGVYTFWRYCRWLGWGFEKAIERGIGFIPITPFDPPRQAASANDDREQVRARRSMQGIPAGAFVVGRIGRNDPGKWDPSNSALVDKLLSEFPEVHWLSIGFPEQRGCEELSGRWPDRFHNLAETSDYELITRTLSSLDVQAFFGHGECFASSIAEAAGSGVPSVALATPLRDNGQAEQVVDGFNGYLVSSAEQAVKIIGGLRNNPALAELKRNTQRHCHERWHIDRATGDLLSLYEYWKNPSVPTPYLQTMIQEAESFGENYRPRMVRLFGKGVMGRLGWRALLWAVQNRRTWQIGRAIKRLRERWRGKSL